MQVALELTNRENLINKGLIIRKCFEATVFHTIAEVTSFTEKAFYRESFLTETRDELQLTLPEGPIINPW